MAVTLTTSGSINTTIDDYGIAILSTTSSVNVGAISLVINVPNGVNVKNVKFPFANSSGSFNQLNGRLYVAGFDLVGTQINTNGVVLEITASGLLTGSFSLDTEYDWNNQFASSSAEAYENYSIRMPELLNPSAILSNQTGFTIGVNTRATNVGSFAGGVGTLASGYAAHAFGVNTTASGYAAFSTGVETDADGTGSFSMGSGSWARGTATVTMGIGTVASSSGQLVVGHYNETKTDINNLFVVGDGTGPLTANRRNIIEVYGGMGASFRGVKIDTAATPAITTTIDGFNVYGRSIFYGGITQSAGIITIDDDFGGITHDSASYIAETYTSLGQLRGRTLLNYKGIDFNSSFLTSAPSSTHLWTNNANRLFYGSDAIILNGGNTLGGAMTIGTNDTNNLQLETGGTTRVFISSSGNVGIGTTTPSVSLQVSDSTQFGNSLDDTHTFTGSINTTGSLSLKGPLYDNLGTAGTPDQILFTTSTGVEWRDNFAENVIITGKNVGVSTIQKGTPLYFTSSGTSGNIVGILPADASNPNRMPAGGVAGEQITAGSEGNIYLSGYISNLDTSAFNSGDNVYVAVGGGYTNIKPTGSAFIQKIGNVEKVNASNGSTVIQGPNWFNDLPNWEIGRVMVGRSTGQPVTSSLVDLDESTSRLGLGTTSPLSTLTIAGGNININSGFAIGGNNLGSFSPFIRYSNTGAGVPSASFGHTTAYMLSDAGGVFGTNDLSFYAGPVTQPEIMRIVGSTGFVGIGESSPSAKLEIKGSGATSATTALRVENSNASASLTILNDGTSAFNTSHLYVSSSGRVGIGTTLPTASLHISGASNSNLLQVQSPVATNIFVVSGSGNVGIGTATPTQKLHIVAGNILLNDTHYVDWANGSERIIGGGGGTGYSLQFSTYGPSTALTEKMRISGSGEVGIGVTVPTARLHVSGASNSGLLEIDSPAVNNIIYVSGSGRVGIGTGTPTNTLQVEGGVTAASFTGSLFGTSSWAVSSSNAITAQTASYFLGQNFATFTQSIASTTWTFNHNLSFRTPVITIYNSSYEVVIPDSITGTSDNQSVITFSTSQSGYATATVGSILPTNTTALMLAYAVVL